MSQTYRGAVAITASDTVSTPPYQGLYIGVTGDVKVKMLNGQSVTFKGAPVGVLPVAVSQVFATGTTATNILGLVI